MVSANILRQIKLITGREAKALLESEILKESDTSGKLEDEDFFRLIEHQNDWLSVFIEGHVPNLRGLIKQGEIYGWVQVSGDFMLDDEKMFDEKRMLGPPDIVAELGRLDVILSGELRSGTPFKSIPGDGKSIMAKVFFRPDDIQKLANIINGIDRASKKADTIQKPKSRTQAQEDAILQGLKSAKYDPLSLPERRPGRAWVKSELWNSLSHEARVFSSKKVFDTAWQRLRDRGDIKESG